MAGGIITPWLSQSIPSGHYSRAAMEPLAEAEPSIIWDEDRGKGERRGWEKGGRENHPGCGSKERDQCRG